MEWVLTQKWSGCRFRNGVDVDTEMEWVLTQKWRPLQSHSIISATPAAFYHFSHSSRILPFQPLQPHSIISATPAVFYHFSHSSRILSFQPLHNIRVQILGLNVHKNSLHSERGRQADRQSDRHAETLTERGRQADKQADRHADTLTERGRHSDDSPVDWAATPNPTMADVRPD